MKERNIGRSIWGDLLRLLYDMTVRPYLIIRLTHPETSKPLAHGPATDHVRLILMIHQQDRVLFPDPSNVSVRTIHVNGGACPPLVQKYQF